MKKQKKIFSMKVYINQIKKKIRKKKQKGKKVKKSKEPLGIKYITELI